MYKISVQELMNSLGIGEDEGQRILEELRKLSGMTSISTQTRSFLLSLAKQDTTAQTRSVDFETESGIAQDWGYASSWLDANDELEEATNPLHGIFKGFDDPVLKQEKHRLPEQLAQVIDSRSYEHLYFAQRIIETVPLPLFLKDIDGHYLWFNHAFEQFFSINRDDWIGKRSDEFMLANEAKVHMGSDQIVLATLEPLKYEAHVTTEQSEHEVIIRKAPLIRPDGTVVGLIGVITDVTESRVQESVIEQARARLKRITNTVPVVVFQLKAKDEKVEFTFVSERVREVRALEPEQLLKNASIAFDQIVEEERAATIKNLYESVRKNESWSGEYRIVLPDGALRWIRCELIPEPELDSDGSSMATGIWQDMTQIKAVDARLREVTDNIPIAVFQSSSLPVYPYLKFSFISRGIERICGLTVEEVIANAGCFDALIFPEDAEELEKQIIETNEKEIARRSFDFRVKHKGL